MVHFDYKSPLVRFLVPDERLKHRHLDIIFTLPLVREFRYFLTMTDRISGWPKAVHERYITAEKVAQAFVQIWVSRFGTPQKITCDTGRQYESMIFQDSDKYTRHWPSYDCFIYTTV